MVSVEWLLSDRKLIRLWGAVMKEIREAFEEWLHYQLPNIPTIQEAFYAGYRARAVEEEEGKDDLPKVRE